MYSIYDVSFSQPDRIKPVKFIWGKRPFEIREVTYRWKSDEGRSVIYHFSVTDGRTLYEISFNSNTLLWRLEALEAG
jgi:hypothetical protein